MRAFSAVCGGSGWLHALFTTSVVGSLLGIPVSAPLANDPHDHPGVHGFVQLITDARV